jgi:D-alanyl-D-alanine carboxypeptidase/D-alanyl-D-alanine-endopeptidase (penicillin-binding protein 4)
VADLLRLMNVPSDDFFAEMLTEQLGARFGDAGSIPAGARVITRDVATYGVHPTIIDGSGLSRADRSSPIEVVDLLRGVSGTPIGDVLSASLPLVGVNGTVRRIAVGTAAQGRCVAKTGTLTGVTNLAGYCHGAGHQLLAFALFLDGPSNERGIGLLSRMVADMVRLDVSRP